MRNVALLLECADDTDTRPESFRTLLSLLHVISHGPAVPFLTTQDTMISSPVETSFGKKNSRSLGGPVCVGAKLSVCRNSEARQK